MWQKRNNLGFNVKHLIRVSLINSYGLLADGYIRKQANKIVRQPIIYFCQTGNRFQLSGNPISLRDSRR